MMRFFRCGSLIALVFVLVGCRHGFLLPYRNLPAHTVPMRPLYHPQIQRHSYRALIDGKFLTKRFHLSGNLLIKKTDDSAVHAVFQNEMGLSFFHFVWYPKDSPPVGSKSGMLFQPCTDPRFVDGTPDTLRVSTLCDSFAVLSILPQLNKPAVIKLLRKDFAMLLQRESFIANNYMQSPNNFATEHPRGRISEVYANPVSGSVFYIGVPYPHLFSAIEEWGRRKKVTTISFAPLPAPTALPDSALIQHHTVNLTIQLNPAPAGPSSDE